MLFRKVLQWTVVLLLIVAAVGGYVAWRTWERRNVLLLEGIRAHMAQHAPTWDVGIEQAKLINEGGKVWLGTFTIKPRGETVPLLHIPDCYVTIDPDLLLKQHQVRIKQVLISQPTVTLIRHADGIWNWQKLGRPTPSDQTPEVVVESGSFVVRVEAAGGLPETEIASRDIALTLLPAGMHRYLIEGASKIVGAGGLGFSGRFDLRTGAWELAGKADGLDMSPSLLQKAAALSPAVRRQVAELSGPPATLVPGAPPAAPNPELEGLVRPASQTVETPPGLLPASERIGPSQLSLPNLGLVANIALDFELASDGTQAVPDYHVAARVMDGQVSEPLFPVPLSGLQGELLLENDRIVIRQVSAAAADGESQLFVDGEVRQEPDRTVKQFKVRATNLWLDPQVRELLPQERQRLFDLINPSGRFSIAARFDSEAAKPLQLDQLIALDCAVRHGMFAFPVERINGMIEQEEEHITVALQGMAAGRPVQINGFVRAPGAEGDSSETLINIAVDRFPIDERLPTAIVSPQHRAAREAIESLSLTGLADIRIQFTRRAADQRFQMKLDADVSQAALTFRGFPYRIEQVSGEVHYDQRDEPIWRFTELCGRHGPAQLSGEASFDLAQTPGQLALSINADNVPLDPDLQAATIAAEPGMQRVWDELNASGWLHLEGLEILWRPHSPPRVAIENIRLDRATVMPRGFPYRWDDVTAELAWSNGRAVLRQASGRHNQTSLVIDGTSLDDPAYVQLGGQKGEQWVLHVPVITVKALDPGGEFAAALPADAATVLRNLDPRGPLDVDLWMEVKGWPGDDGGGAELITAAWWFNVELNNDRLFAGVELTDVTGRVEAVVKWADNRVLADGKIALDRARALDMSLTDIRGPFSVNGTQLDVGSVSVLRAAPLKAPTDEQLTAALYGGLLKVNAHAEFNPPEGQQSVYEVQVDVDNADLSRWANEWGAAAYNVAGTVNALMHLHGRGTSPLALHGEGCRVQITDARFGELPQMMQLLGQFTQLKQPDKAWFRYAYAEFSVENGVFDFGPVAAQVPGDTRRIQFDGDMVRMVGRGTIPFAEGIDPRMNLVFESKFYERNRLMLNIPFISPIAKSMMDNYLRVEVAGTPNRPSYRLMTQVPIGNVNDALREIFTTVESGLTPMLPRVAP